MELYYDARTYKCQKEKSKIFIRFKVLKLSGVMNQGDLRGNFLRKNAPYEERNNVIKDTKTNLKYLKNTNRMICKGEMARLIKARNSKSQLLTVRLTTNQCLSKTVTILITGVANITNNDLWTC